MEDARSDYEKLAYLLARRELEHDGAGPLGFMALAILSNRPDCLEAAKQELARALCDALPGERTDEVDPAHDPTHTLDLHLHDRFNVLDRNDTLVADLKQRIALWVSNVQEAQGRVIYKYTSPVVDIRKDDLWVDASRAPMGTWAIHVKVLCYMHGKDNSLLESAAS